MRGKANPARCPQCGKRDPSVLYRHGEWCICNWCYWERHPSEMPQWALRNPRAREVIAAAAQKAEEGP